jgi:hypothetical protein
MEFLKNLIKVTDGEEDTFGVPIEPQAHGIPVAAHHLNARSECDETLLHHLHVAPLPCLALCPKYFVSQIFDIVLHGHGSEWTKPLSREVLEAAQQIKLLLALDFLFSKKRSR